MTSVGVAITQKEREWVIDLWCAGHTVNNIWFITKVSRNTVRDVLHAEGYQTDPNAPEDPEESAWKKAWLKKNWHLSAPHKEQKNSKYRLVRKGEMGHLRTPYRPDGRFR